MAGESVVSVISMDSYFQTETHDDGAAVNFDHPGHLDLNQMLADLDALRAGRVAEVPSYDFRTMRQTPRAQRVDPTPVVIVEGLFVLGEPIVSRFDLTCFLDVADDQRLLGRILRDRTERNATIEEIVDRYQRFVRPSYAVFVAPARHNADVVVDFTYRRAFFARLLAHIVRDYVRGELDLASLIHEIRQENYTIGYRMDQGVMPATIDLRDLARAYPETAFPPSMPNDVGPGALYLGREGH